MPKPHVSIESIFKHDPESERALTALLRTGFPPIDLNDPALCALYGDENGHVSRDALDRFMRDAAEKPATVLGEKPQPSETEEIFMIEIPQDRLCIRLFPGGTSPETGTFFFDFYDTQQCKAVNAPHGYSVELLHPQYLAGPITSVEAVWGVETIKPGMEKFAVVENAHCCLERPGKESFNFHIPCRESPGFAHAVPLAYYRGSANARMS